MSNPSVPACKPCNIRRPVCVTWYDLLMRCGRFYRNHCANVVSGTCRYRYRTFAVFGAVPYRRRTPCAVLHQQCGAELRTAEGVWGQAGVLRRQGRNLRRDKPGQADEWAHGDGGVPPRPVSPRPLRTCPCQL